MRYSAFFIMLLLFVCLGSTARSQHPTELSPGYYIVVGAYAPSRENVAQNYTEVLNRKGLNAGYGFNSSRNYFYVYLQYYSSLKESLKDMKNRRRQPEFAQAWVRVVPGDIVAKAIPSAPVKSNSAAEAKKEEVKPTEIRPAEGKEEKVLVSSKPVTETPATSVQKTQPVTDTVQPDAEPVIDNPPIQQYDKITLGNTEVFLSLFNATNNRIVEGTIKVIDTERTKVIAEVKGNEYLVLPDPKSKTGQLTMICEAFGYRKIQQEINYPLPLADTVKDYIDLMGTTFVVNFDLIRYHRGDIATLYHVYFYNDAALMLPESKYELNSLLQMMQENPKFRIKLHGHTNGNYHGRIITVGESKNFFSLDGSKSSIGSAKDLSYNRAEVIKEYLESNGIEPSRVEVKAWGGKRPIYDRHGVNAKKNVRVEVEIIGE
jgi:outer membrane protein OmpA-like peptidoglycan-associated protein